MTEIQLPSQQQRNAEISQATAVEQARAVAEVAAAVRVAQQFPRDEEQAYAAMRRACGSKRLAERAFYAVQNRGNGPSVHLARELARIWGNNDYGVRELRRDGDDTADGKSEILAYAWDQQTNMRSSRSFIQPHARMAGGRRRALTDLQDIYLNNQNTGARAVRECIFSVLPSDFVEEAQELCHATLTQATTNTGVPMETQIQNAVSAYTSAGVTVGQLEKRFGPVTAWTPAILASTHVLWTSLQRNELTLAEAFEPAEPARVTAAEIQEQAQKTVDHAAKAAATGAPGPAPVQDAQLPPSAPQAGDSAPVAPPQDPAPGTAMLDPRGALGRRMFGLFKDAGMTDRGDRLAYAADVVQRQLSTSSDLTEADAHRVIASLEADLAAQAEATAPQGDDGDPGDDPTLDPSWGNRGD